MKIKSIYIDGFHNAVNKTYNFGDIVYIFGNNGIGKSTILQAIQFALLGYIPHIAKNSKEALLRHSPKGKILIRLELCEVGGEINTVNIERCVTKTMNQVNICPSDYDLESVVKDLELPIFNFNEFVGQTANKLKEYFIKNILPISDGNIDWKQILTDSISDCNFQDKNEVIDYGLSLIDDIKDEEPEILNQVIRANTLFKEEQSFKKSELQRLQNTIDSLIYYDDYVGPTNIEEINAQLLSLNAFRDQRIRYNSAYETSKNTLDELQRLKLDIDNKGGKEAFNNLQTRLDMLKAKFNEISTRLSDKQKELTAIRTKDADTTAIIQSNGVCPYTKTTCKSMTTMIEDLRNESVKYKAEAVKYSEEIETLNLELNEINLNIRKCESNISDFLSIWERIVTLEKLTTDLPQLTTDKTLEELNLEIDVLTQSKSKLEANIRYNETIENITKLKYESELKMEALSHWAKTTDTNGLQTTLMEKPFEDLATEMTSHIQEMYGNQNLKAHFNVSSKANSFSFGLIREGVYIPYDLLSSGEKCLYCLALMIYIVNNSKSPLKVLLLDDAFDHLDSNVIENTFAVLKNIKGIQYIFAGVKECKNAQDILLEV